VSEYTELAPEPRVVCVSTGFAAPGRNSEPGRLGSSLVEWLLWPALTNRLRAHRQKTSAGVGMGPLHPVCPHNSRHKLFAAGNV